MMRFLNVRLCALLSAFAMCCPAFGADVPSQVVHLEIDHVTNPGESVFVLGDIDELGGDDVTHSVKLVAGDFTPGHLLWAIDIAIPQGVTYTYQYVVRSDAIEDLSDPVNGAALTGPASDATDPPTPPTRDLAIFAPTSWSVSEATFNTTGGPIVVPFLPVPGYAETQAAVLRDQPAGVGVDAQVLSYVYDTSLHEIYCRFSRVYNYVPTSFDLPASQKDVFVISTSLIAHTRVVDSVSGRGIQVRTPRAYADHTDRYYPVLYMHDGQNVFVPGGPFGTWQAENVAGLLAATAQARELIIVAIDNSDDRLREYNPDWSNSLNAEYNTFLVDELKPYIDANYRTLPNAANTSVIGSSFGGIASLSLALDYPGVFGKVGAMSTSFWATSLDTRLANGDLPLTTRVYLDAGDISDGGEETTVVRDALLDTGRVFLRDLFFQIGYGHAHNEDAWHDRLPDALLALFPITDEANLIDLPLPIVGDLDSDCDVDLSDLATLLSNYGVTSGAAYADGDLDGDGDVDLSDLAALLAVYGDVCD